VKLECKKVDKEDELIDELVVEDVSSVLVFMVKNRQKFDRRHPSQDLIHSAIQQSLTLDNKHR
jgi:hypothetical protein